MASNCAGGGLDWIPGKYRKRKNCQTFKQAAQGSCWFTVPGGI